MKKAMIIAIFFIATLQVKAQFDRKMVFVGVRAGANFSQLQTNNFSVTKLGSSVSDFFKNNSDYRTGYVVGLYTRVGRKFYIQPEFLLSSKGGTIEILKNGVTEPVKVDVTFSQIDIPVLFGVKVGPLRLNAGPMASLNISQGQKLKEALQTYTSQNINRTIDQAVFGYQAGVGVSLRSFNIDLRYEGSLSNVAQLNLQNNAQFNTKVSLWQLTAGLNLF